MKKFIESLKNKNIHIVGITGAEGSNILRFLLKHRVTNITGHDFLSGTTIEKSFKLWHKGINIQEKNSLFKKFESDLSKINFHKDLNYLKDIEKADIVFVPQSWRLYKKQNKKLWDAKNKGIPFYTITKLYLELAPCKIIGVTGTVGKGSTANLIYHILKENLPSNRKVFFAGNETWRNQLADKLDEMRQKDYLILEISHRQLLDGIERAPFAVVITNIYPNHIDEVSWEKYKELKLLLPKLQNSNDLTVLNYDIPLLTRISNLLKSNVIFFSEKNKEMNNKDVQKIYNYFMSNKSTHYLSNILASSVLSIKLGINNDQIIKTIKSTPNLSARMELLGEVKGIKIYDDIKSTTPWATLSAVKKLTPNVILIAGGRTKGIDYSTVLPEIEKLSKKIIILNSELNIEAKKILHTKSIINANQMNEAINIAIGDAKSGDSILISPGAGFFYSDFIKGKKSIKKIISLLQEEQA